MDCSVKDSNVAKTFPVPIANTYVSHQQQLPERNDVNSNLQTRSTITSQDHRERMKRLIRSRAKYSSDGSESSSMSFEENSSCLSNQTVSDCDNLITALEYSPGRQSKVIVHQTKMKTTTKTASTINNSNYTEEYCDDFVLDHDDEDDDDSDDIGERDCFDVDDEFLILNKHNQNERNLKINDNSFNTYFPHLLRFHRFRQDDSGIMSQSVGSETRSKLFEFR
ncbi:hypothetical protein SSS_08895 [Sarcoptes scabiei]|uniref:Uncharacterized protein n=1 Tax=Sarcoptes scabiei TaxID=52283 RepID=A0A834RBG1_SARSC|nr:hypothetical protein SSS_08895 [Sarcoptes scabiei]